MDEPVGGSPVDLPLRVRIDPTGRREMVRALGWGWRDGVRVAFGSAEMDVAPDLDEVTRLVLRAHCPGNLLVNPSFDDAVQPWIPENAVLDLVPGLSGQGLEVCWDEDGTDYAAKVQQDITGVAAGTVYRLDLWLRMDSPADHDQGMEIDLKEFDGTTQVDSKTTGLDVVPTGAFLFFSGTSDPAAPGSTRLEVQVEANDVSLTPAPPYCFTLDELCLEAQPP
jgi:hypothetical protein